MNRFFNIYNSIIDDATLKSTHKSLLLSILRYYNWNLGYAYPSIDTLLVSSGISRSTFFKIRYELVNMNYLEFESEIGQVSKYRLGSKLIQGRTKSTTPPSPKIDHKQTIKQTSNKNTITNHRTRDKFRPSTKSIPLIAYEQDFDYFYGNGWMSELSTEFIC